MDTSNNKQKDISYHINKVLEIHRDQAAKNKESAHTKNRPKHEFNQHQEEFFDQQASWYISAEATPNEVKLTLSKMFNIIREKYTSFSGDGLKVLDVGCGAGVLIPFIQNTFQTSNIHGVDLSGAQLFNLKKRYPEVQIHHGDISEFNSESGFHLIICNACFGNFYSQQDALATMTNLLAENGHIVISHPLGANFVKKLHLQDANTVPHHLPVQENEIQKLCSTNGLRAIEFVNEALLYLLILQK